MADDSNNWESHRLLVLDSMSKTNTSLMAIQTILHEIQTRVALNGQVGSDSKDRIEEIGTQMKDEFSKHDERITSLEKSNERWLGMSTVISSIVAALVGVFSGWLINSPPSGPPGT